MDLQLIGKKALITGGSKGIGLAIKKALEAEGVECTSWSRSEGVDLMKEIPKVPKVDILINNVGGMGTCSYEDSADCMFKNYGIMNIITERFLEKCDPKKYGRVITISSIFGKETGENPWFCASKSSQIAYMKSQSKRWSEYEIKRKGKDIKGSTITTTYKSNITFNTICPGYINTKPEIREYAKKHSISAVGKPEDVANIVVFLCSPKANFINGACITVDGGESHSF